MYIVYLHQYLSRLKVNSLNNKTKSWDLVLITVFATEIKDLILKRLDIIGLDTIGLSTPKPLSNTIKRLDECVNSALLTKECYYL